jgi:thiol-disulfide isomerase/thioredoxin
MRLCNVQSDYFMRILKKEIFTMAVLIAVAAIGVIFFFSDLTPGTSQETKNDTTTNNGVRQFDKAPDFSLKDYSGKEVSLADFRGTVVVVNSWAVWCPFCKEELSDFALLQEEFGKDVVIIAIDRSETLQKAKGFTDSIGVTDRMIFLLDPADTFYKSIGGFSMPETLFVDAEGNIRLHRRGPLSFEEMKTHVQSLLN